MLWSILIAYALISQLVIGGCLVYCICQSDDAEFQAFRQVNSPLETIRFVMLIAVSLLLAPLVLPVCAVMYFRCLKEAITECKEMRRTQRSYFESTLDPVHECNMDSDLLQYISDQSEVLTAFGFESLGDHWIKPQPPFKSKGRFFLSHDGSHIVEIARTSEQLYCEVSTFLENGDYVSSAICPNVKLFSKMRQHGIYVFAQDDLELDQLLPHHDRLLNEALIESDSEVRIVSSGRWKEYMHYQNRHFAQVALNLGDKDEGPEPYTFPAPDHYDQPATLVIPNG